MDDRLYRSRTDRMLAGVCGGLADRLALDPSLVRIGWVLLTIVSGGIFLLLYIVMAIVVPEAPPAGWPPAAPQPPGPGAVPGWNPPAGASGAAGATTVAAAPDAAAEAPGAASADAAADAQAPGSTPSGWQPPAGSATPMWSAPPPSAEHERRGGAAVLVIGLGFILLGGWLFIRPYVPDFGFELRSLWPVAVIVLGVLLVIAAMRPGGTRPR